MKTSQYLFCSHYNQENGNECRQISDGSNNMVKWVASDGTPCDVPNHYKIDYSTQGTDGN